MAFLWSNLDPLAVVVLGFGLTWLTAFLGAFGDWVIRYLSGGRHDIPET